MDNSRTATARQMALMNSPLMVPGILTPKLAIQREVSALGGRRVISPTSNAPVTRLKEQIRIRAIVEGNPDIFPPTLPDPIAEIRVDALDERHFAAWRDRRLRHLTPSSVRREWSLLSNTCTIAINEWRLMERHPMRTVKRPADSEARTRRPTDDEIERLLHCLGYAPDQPPATKTARVGAAIMFAIETAMRAGEISGLCWQDVEFERRFVRTHGKTPAARREVPLSSEAIRVLQQLHQVRDGDSVFQLGSASLDALYRKAKAKAGIGDLHFHDLRHEAITRLSKVLDVLALARAVGHRDLKMLMIYYNPSAEDLAGRLK
jgi:integrase